MRSTNAAMSFFASTSCGVPVASGDLVASGLAVAVADDVGLAGAEVAVEEATVGVAEPADGVVVAAALAEEVGFAPVVAVGLAVAAVVAVGADVTEGTAVGVAVGGFTDCSSVQDEMLP